jgi:hypothetical protein
MEQNQLMAIVFNNVVRKAVKKVSLWRHHEDDLLHNDQFATPGRTNYIKALRCKLPDRMNGEQFQFQSRR